ncbi:hypothetical protein P175DRAFT_0502307 [Aspergillus ochraceoroseus IBT 24754]|uniref:Small ribosomal subunit protein bS18m n=3 Tax=Aspergillus subgen. Nidulantes TaxID=2720870 RepID=A0A0F8VQW6_9EURO|nr:uncharacterized protein P175DRAFT_0502307 [Aspergillus ochraceoroseus IBT 24754]KKK21952.1 mitochondrial 37S ribosomal protein [Aspergillus ochraceoroseus]KKK25596.1 mitochondrial 37S ribosomal protein [Aspergillus rambellii]PTU20151.1 hypothetical protein P175DRAFT_0502307 [Aspergillus ochraceoroseus IBT 24754]
MSLNLFSLSSLRTLGSTLQSACRFNSTTATNAALENLQRPPRATQNIPRAVRRRAPNRLKFIEAQKAQAESRALERFQTREWKAGDIYAPHDLSPAEMKKWRKRYSPETDAFDSLNMNPLDVYKNFSILSEYITPMGRIKHRKETGLRPANQRKIAKAIRRAIGLGLMPSVHRHPEILAAEAKARMDSSGFF